MLLDLRRPRRRIDRHRDAARQQNAHEAREVVLAGGQHQHDRFGGRQPETGEPGRQPRRAVEQRGEFDFHGLALIVEKADVGAVAVMLRLPSKGVGQRFHMARHEAARTGGKPGSRRGSGPGRRGRGSETPDEVARGLRFGQQRLRERAIEPRFDPVQQLHPRQAVEPEVPLQRRIQAHLGGPGAGAELPAHRRDQFEEGFVAPGRLFGGGHHGAIMTGRAAPVRSSESN